LFEDWMMFCGVLSQTPLKILELHDNRFDLQCATRWVAQILLHCRQLQKLLLLGNHLDCHLSDDWNLLCQALSQCLRLNILAQNICFNDVSPDAWTTFCGALSQCQELQTLQCDNNDLNNESWMMLFRSLSQYPKFRKLILVHNNLHTFLPMDWINIGQALSQCPQLQSLVLAQGGSLQGLSCDYWRALGDAVSQSSQLEVLDLVCDALYTLVPDNWVALFQGLSQCQKLQKLNVGRAFRDGGGMSVDNCIVLCAGLSQLQTLDLFGNQIHQRSLEDWQVWCEALSQCRQLSTLSVNFFCENDEAYQRIFLQAMPDFCGELQVDLEESKNICQPVFEENRRKTKDCMVGAVDVLRHILPVQELRPVVLSFLFPIWQKPLLQRIDHIMEAKEKRKAGIIFS
jgi:hypothetical protein